MSYTGGPSFHLPQQLREILAAKGCWLWILGIIGMQAILRPGWYQTFGLALEGIFAGKVWQLFTYGLLHGGWWHVATNSFFILAIGSRIEWMMGHKTMTQAMVLGILAGGVCHLILGARGGILVGLSGGGMSLLLLLTTLSPQSRMMPIPVSGKNLGIGLLVSALILSLIDPSLGLPWFSKLGRGFANHGMGNIFQMGHACHLGGGMAGWLMGRWRLRPRVTLEELRQDREKRETH